MEDFFDEIRNRKISVWRKIYLWWKFEGQYYYADFKRGIKNLWYWLPVIWKDRNWDHGYIFTILKHKINSQAQYIENRNLHTRSQDDARKMRLCVKLIDKLQDDFYQMEYTNYSDDKHWFEPCNDGTTNSIWKSENIWEKYDDYFKKYPLIYKRVMNGEGFTSLEGREDDKHVIAMCIAHLNHDRARKLLFKIMESEIEKWWD